jgi:hypothetical protein
VAALNALPGIGVFVAITLIAEIGDVSRFPDARRLCCWAGLTVGCIYSVLVPDQAFYVVKPRWQPPSSR